jgi:putative alpha-1,2-mannosidase
MKNKLLILMTIVFFSCKTGHHPSEDLVQYVNDIIGTTAKGDGGNQPNVNPPFAMTNFSPVTDESMICNSCYHYEKNQIIGFTGNHHASPCMGDFGFVTLWPSVNNIKIKASDRHLFFRHEEEIATPQYYSVILHAPDSSYQVKTEMTSTSRCCLMKFTAPASDAFNLVVEMCRSNQSSHSEAIYKCFTNEYKAFVENGLKQFIGYVKINKEKNEIVGYNPEWQHFHLGPKLPNFKGYFVIQFDKPFDSFGTFSDSVIKNNKAEDKGNWVGGIAGFKTKEGDQIKLKIGTSFISIDQARINLDKEIPDWDFEKIRQQSHDAWQAMLERIQIKGTDEQKHIFYTAMYRALLYPREFSEYGKYYSPYDDGISYNSYSIWDTYRALNPMHLFIARERVTPIITSLLQMYKEFGWLPKFPDPAEINVMVGTHSDAIIADAYIKGVRDFDINLAYEAMRKDAFVPPVGDTGKNNYVPDPWKWPFIYSLPEGEKKKGGNAWWDRELWNGYEARAGLTWYKKLGYVPIDMTSESVSSTLEGAYDDFCVAQVAKALGKNEDYDTLMKHSRYYKNIYNKVTGFIEPRLSNGDWYFKDEDILSGKLKSFWDGFTEGDQWTYLFSVAQDVPGMIDMMGGPEKFAAKLDSCFNGGHFVHENEPGHNYPYLYNYAGYYSKTQERVRRYTLSQYRNAPDGIDGNDDCGQMSAWFMFSAMGFYPVCPGTDEYAIGSPLLPEVTMYLPNGNVFKIIAKNVSNENKYIQSITLNGKNYEKYFIKHSDIMNGGEIVFEMGNKPL